MINSLSTNGYIDEILHQPEALRDTISAFEAMGYNDFIRLAERLSASSWDRIVLTGMGSSYHALHPLQLQLVQHDFHAQMIETSELIHFARRLLSPKTLVVAVSQSGQSVEMLQLLELARGKIPLIGVTNTPESPLAKNSELAVLTRAGDERSISCKTYITALAALSVLGDLLTGQQLHNKISTLQACADAVAHYLSQWEDFVESAIQMMKGVKYLALTGRGASLAATGTGSLIIKEAAQFPAEGMSCAAFRHGPMELLSPEVFVLVYEGTGPTRKLNANLVADIRKAGARAELITTGEGNPSLAYLPSVPDELLPLMEILPAQLTSIALAVLNNHSPGILERTAKITIVE